MFLKRKIKITLLIMISYNIHYRKKIWIYISIVANDSKVNKKNKIFFIKFVKQGKIREREERKKKIKKST